MPIDTLHWDRRGRGRWLAELALDEIARATALPLGLPTPRDPRLLRAVAALRANPADPRRLENLAALAGASSRTLARLFRAEAGLSFRLSSDIRNPSGGDTENPSTPATVMPRLAPVRVWP